MSEEKVQRPSVGRSVHYVAYGTPGGEFAAGVCRAAVITEVYYGPAAVTPPITVAVQLNPETPGVCWSIGLCVLNPTGLFFNRGIPYDEDMAPGSWHWPERT